MLQKSLAEQNNAKDIAILDSEFAQEESQRNIEDYYRSVNKESAEIMNSFRAARASAK